MRSRAIELVGTTIGRLRILAVGYNAGKRLVLDCVCACGTHKTIRACHVMARKTTSCGCWHDEAARLNNVTHGHHPKGRSTAEYRAWCGMITRCERPRVRSYKDYGGRGIAVCERWRTSFEDFLADMGPRPSPEHSIDRIDVNGNYEPTNCRWATRSQQASNTRTTPRYEIRGELLCATEVAERYGVDNRRFWYRVNTLGWSPERAALAPVKGRAA